MPLTEKGKKIMRNMKEQYGAKKGKEVFYASQNKGTIEGTHKTSEAYEAGFAAKCAQSGFDPEKLIKLAQFWKGLGASMNQMNPMAWLMPAGHAVGAYTGGLFSGGHAVGAQRAGQAWNQGNPNAAANRYIAQTRKNFGIDKGPGITNPQSTANAIPGMNASTMSPLQLRGARHAGQAMAAAKPAVQPAAPAPAPVQQVAKAGR